MMTNITSHTDLSIYEISIFVGGHLSRDVCVHVYIYVCVAQIVYIRVQTLSSIIHRKIRLRNTFGFYFWKFEKRFSYISYIRFGFVGIFFFRKIIAVGGLIERERERVVVRTR